MLNKSIEQVQQELMTLTQNKGFVYTYKYDTEGKCVYKDVKHIVRMKKSMQYKLQQQMQKSLNVQTEKVLYTTYSTVHQKYNELSKQLTQIYKYSSVKSCNLATVIEEYAHTIEVSLKRKQEQVSAKCKAQQIQVIVQKMRDGCVYIITLIQVQKQGIPLLICYPATDETNYVIGGIEKNSTFIDFIREDYGINVTLTNTEVNERLQTVYINLMSGIVSFDAHIRMHAYMTKYNQRKAPVFDSVTYSVMLTKLGFPVADVDIFAQNYIRVLNDAKVNIDAFITQNYHYELLNKTVSFDIKNIPDLYKVLQVQINNENKKVLIVRDWHHNVQNFKMSTEAATHIREVQNKKDVCDLEIVVEDAMIEVNGINTILIESARLNRTIETVCKAEKEQTQQDLSYNNTLMRKVFSAYIATIGEAQRNVYTKYLNVAERQHKRAYGRFIVMEKERQKEYDARIYIKTVQGKQLNSIGIANTEVRESRRRYIKTVSRGLHKVKACEKTEGLSNYSEVITAKGEKRLMPKKIDISEKELIQKYKDNCKLDF